MARCPDLWFRSRRRNICWRLKLKAVRVTDPLRGETERLDILNLMQVVGISTAEDAIALLGRYFPISAASSEKQRFLLKNMNREGAVDAPKYPR